jgi:hypothetical protein
MHGESLERGFMDFALATNLPALSSAASAATPPADITYLKERLQ